MIFNLNKVNHVGFVVRDLEASMKSYWEAFGIGPWKITSYGAPITTDNTFHGKPVKHRYIVGEALGGGFEIMQRLEGETVYKEFLEKKGVGLHHIAYLTNDIEPVLAKVKEAGIEVVQSGRYGKDSYHYLDTEPKFGFMIELVTDHGWMPAEKWYPEGMTW
jgi:catechol 2,3-dioxygenase-like lactoylglutathione lyase family enzyme